jgi:hypothetical protein
MDLFWREAYVSIFDIYRIAAHLQIFLRHTDEGTNNNDFEVLEVGINEDDLTKK